MTREISPVLRGLIVSTFALVAGWLVWHRVTDHDVRPLISASALTEQIHSFPLAPGSSPLGKATFVDRQTFRYIEQDYSTSSGPEEVFRHYDTSLQDAGWRPSYKGANEQWFCRDGMLSSVVFWGTPSAYKVRLTTGSSSCR